MKETYENWGIPLTVIPKRKQFRQKKKGITKSKKKEVLQTLDKNKNDCLFRVNHQYPNHHWKIRAKTQTRSNV